MKTARVLFLSLALLALAAPVAAQERIADFSVDATLTKDRILTVTETITYDFGTAERHGIYRDIPEVADRAGAKYRYHFNFTGVTMDGKPATYVDSSSNGSAGVKIGDADKTITGKHVYAITYTTERAINDFPDHRELYWNVTGNGWTIPIDRAKITVHAPAAPTKSVCYTGPYGSTDEACTIGQKDLAATVTAKNPLAAGEGLTFALAYPLDAIDALPASDRVRQWIQDNAWAFLPVIVFVVMFLIWRKYGKEPKGRGTIVPEYEEPDKMEPALMAALMEQKVSDRAISATILDLARRGYFKIKFSGDPAVKGWFVKKPEISFLKEKTAGAECTPFEQSVWNAIFNEPDVPVVVKNLVNTIGLKLAPEQGKVLGGDEVKLSSLSGKAYTDIQSAKNKIAKALVERKWMRNNPPVVRALWIMAGVFMFVQGWFFVALFGPLYILTSIVAMAIVIAFGWQMPQMTKEGAILKERCEGFKWFLSVTEKQRLDFTDAPERRPEQFEKFLPAAVAFGVEEKWAGQFASMQIPPPSYMDAPVNGWNAIMIANAMTSFQSTASSSMYSAPSSAGGGGSGFSGGGSGGGGGGGGGGSW